jgi:hypothetical protein
LFGFGLLVAFLASACGGAMGPALTAFEEGRHPDAMQEFRSLEPDSRDWSQGERARYALYRGLTHLACGDVRAADHWLSRAKRTWEHNPGVFDDQERGRMIAAWRTMGRMPGELPTR